MHLTAADRALAAKFDGPLERNSQVHPALQPFVNSIAPRDWYRVEADWQGGGFALTLPCYSEAEALAWGQHKARFHPDAVIKVERRETAGEYAQRRAAEEERRALLSQVAAQDRVGKPA